MTAPLTPRSGIRLRGGAPIPPAPSLGVNVPVAGPDGTHIGSVNGLAPGVWVAVCEDCHAPLGGRTTERLATGALRIHRYQDHGRRAA
jgi:hypothetical protein